MHEIVQITFTASGKTAAELSQEHHKARKQAEGQIRSKNEQLKKNLENFHKKWDSKHAIDATGEKAPVPHAKDPPHSSP